METTSELLPPALIAAQRGSDEILKVYSSANFETESKSDKSPLTLADRMAHLAIQDELEKSGIPILSEEGKSLSYEERKSWDSLWIVDPLDGTKEFIKRNGEFTVNIALIHKGQPVFGIVWVPVTGKVYLGAEGKGAYSWTQNKNEALPLTWDAISEKANRLPEHKPDTFTVVGSRSHMSPETEAYIKTKQDAHGRVEVISKGSSLKLCMVAEGLAHEYPRFAPTMEWDTAAGQAVCMASGAEVVRWPEQEPLTYNREDLLNPWFLVRRA